MFRDQDLIGYMSVPRWREIHVPFSENGFFLMDTACEKDSEFFLQSLDDLSE